VPRDQRRIRASKYRVPLRSISGLSHHGSSSLLRSHATPRNAILVVLRDGTSAWILPDCLPPRPQKSKMSYSLTEAAALPMLLTTEEPPPLLRRRSPKLPLPPRLALRGFLGAAAS